MPEEDENRISWFKYLKKSWVKKESSVFDYVSLFLFTTMIFYASILIFGLKTTIIIFSFILFIIIILFSLTIASVRFCKLLLYCEVPTIEESLHVYIKAGIEDNGYSIVDIQSGFIEGTLKYWIFFHELKYIFNEKQNAFIVPQEFENTTIDDFRQFTGYTEEKLIEIKKIYGKNLSKHSIPSILSVFLIKCVAPEALISYIGIITEIIQKHYIMAIYNSAIILYEKIRPCVSKYQSFIELQKKFKVYDVKAKVRRNGKIESINPEDLLPGDIYMIENNNLDIPADMILLRGVCMVNESTLTGESLPQLKQTILSVDGSQKFDPNRYGRLHMLYRGTNIISIHNSSSTNGSKDDLKNSCEALVLNIGFYTAKGRIMRSLSFEPDMSTTEATPYTIYYSMYVIVAALVSLSYWYKRIRVNGNKNFDLFATNINLFLACIPFRCFFYRWLVLYQAEVVLYKYDIKCKDGLRIAYGNKIDVCCFDKTGTLTEEEIKLDGIYEINDGKTQKANLLAEKNFIPILSCLSDILNVSDNFKLEISKEILTELKEVTPEKDIISWNKYNLEIKRRFPFDHVLKRMSCIVRLSERNNDDNIPKSLYYAIKGAPDVLREMFINITPDVYDQFLAKFSHDGFRVLACGYKVLEDNIPISERKLNQLESNILFSHFIVEKCDIKPSAKQLVEDFQNIGIFTTMITGDSAPTACYVCEKIRLSSQPVLVLCLNTKIKNESVNIWRLNSDESETFPLNKENIDGLLKKYNFCITSDGYKFLNSSKIGKEILDKILPKISVFARIDPSEKEEIVSLYKKSGLYTMMVGDGANDVGALRAAHVGVSIVNDPVKLRESIQKTNNDSCLNAPFVSNDSSLHKVAVLINNCIRCHFSNQKIVELFPAIQLLFSYSFISHSFLGIPISQANRTMIPLFKLLSFYFLYVKIILMEFPKKRPLKNIINYQTMISSVIKATLTFTTLVVITKYSLDHDVSRLMNTVNVMQDVESNVTGTVIIISEILMFILFNIINYPGRPFMLPLHHRLVLLSTLIIPFITYLFLLLNPFKLLSDFNFFAIVPNKIKLMVSITIFTYSIIIFYVEKILCCIFERKNSEEKYK